MVGWMTREKGRKRAAACSAVRADRGKNVRWARGVGMIRVHRGLIRLLPHTFPTAGVRFSTGRASRTAPPPSCPARSAGILPPTA